MLLSNKDRELHWDCKRSEARFRSLKADCTDFINDDFVTYFLDLIASIKKETFIYISFEIYSDNKIWDLNWIYFEQNQEKFQT